MTGVQRPAPLAPESLVAKRIGACLVWVHERPKDDLRVESVRLPTADIGRRGPHVAEGPGTDSCTAKRH